MHRPRAALSGKRMYSVSEIRRLACAVLLLCATVVHARVDDAELDLASLTPMPVPAVTGQDRLGLRPMNDDDLRAVHGQDGSLFVADTIQPNELVGANAYSNFTFKRMGLDARLDVNLNIGKVQLGCGGINDALSGGPACDIDIDYLSLMGINATGDRPSPLGPDSDFSFIRPYIELAIKNENSRTLREVAGIKVGAQRVNGALSMGRQYNTNTSNLENPGETCNPAATVGAGVLGCNSGVNSISGFLSLEMSAGFNARANIAGFINTNLEGCFGRLSPGFGRCNSNTTPFFVDAGGTRLDVLHAAAARLEVSNIDTPWWCFGCDLIVNAIISEGYGQLVIDTRLLHYLTVPNTENFFFSFQREPIAYPNYGKAPPPSNIPFDACNPAYGQRTARCNSAYAPVANTGWWLNAPGAKLLNIAPPDRINVGTVDLGTVISLLGPSGRLVIDNPKLGMTPSDNCYGAAQFC